MASHPPIPDPNSPSINETQSLLLHKGEEEGVHEDIERQRKIEEESMYGPSKNSTFDMDNLQEAATGAGYVHFLKSNKQFDLVWIGSVVSLTGDWLTEIACLTLLGEHGASPLYISLYLISKELPSSVWSPFTGVLADLFDRRKIMVGADIIRMFIVIGYLFVMKIQSGFVWALIGVSFLQASISSFFQPAAASFIPMIVPSNQLLIAETLQGASWSTVLLLGASLGGVFSIFFGIGANFIADSVTYLLSAICLSFLFRFPYKRSPLRTKNKNDADSTQDIIKGEETQKEELERRSVLLGSLVLWADMLKNAVVYLRTHRYIMLICSVKFFGTLLWNGFDMVIIEFAQKYFVKGKGGELSLSILYAAGGVGSWLGPFVPTISINDTSRNNLLCLLFGWWFIAVGCVSSAFVPNLVLACVTNAVRSSGVALLWTYSEVIKDKLVPEKILGRVSAFELALVPLATVVSRLSVSWALEKDQSAFLIAFILGSIGLVFSIVWTCVILSILRKQR